MDVVKHLYRRVFFSIYDNLKKNLKIYLSFIFLIIGGFLVFLIIKDPDASILKHLDDLFVKGPLLVIENLYGCGFSKEIGIESDLILYFIRIGCCGGVLYIALFISLFHCYSKKSITNDYLIKRGKHLLIIYFIASIFLPLTLQRPISNMFWLYEGLVYSYRRQLCKTLL